MKDISTYINNEFITESKLYELKTDDVIKILTKYGFDKSNYTIKSNNIYIKSEDIAQEITDELTGVYDIFYDDENNYKLTIFK